jgi:NAD(P)-dependent dehydrogenase (short-subunit alcohol dehydrogenase family)
VQFDLLDGNPAELLQALGGSSLDYLVNAAGLALFDRDGSVLDTDEAVWDATFGVNLHALRHLTVAAVPLLRAGRGKSIVNVASTAGVRGMDSPLDAYQVSKAAVVSLTRSLALQLGPEGIRANTVCPGAILTPMVEPLYVESPARRTDMEQRTPMRRLGLPEDIASAIAFLLSEQASFITATDLVVDGGWTAQIK